MGYPAAAPPQAQLPPFGGHSKKRPAVTGQMIAPTADSLRFPFVIFPILPYL